MYLGIDVGGTKTLFAVFDKAGKIVYEKKIPTNKSYIKFLKDVGALIKADLAEFDIRQACCAIPGKVDRRRGMGVDFGNLAWHNTPIKDDFKKLLHGVPVLVENDANLAGLSEALLVHKKYNKALYLTVSTGIGGGLIIDGKIDEDFADIEPGHMMINHEGVLQQWEDFASGRALKARYGKLASEIDDASIWRAYSLDLAIGIQELLAIIQPDVVIIGGGVGSHFEKFGAYLEGELFKMKDPMVENPPITAAKRPEEAVIYGCFDFIKQTA
jgi:predicted NBD/HSP70 family sugar kinase